MRSMLDATVQVSTADSWNRRLVVLSRGPLEHSDRFDLDDAWRREQFLNRAIETFGWSVALRQPLMERVWAEAVRADDDQAQSPRPQAVVRRFSEIEPRGVEWLWPRRIAVGKLTLLAGDPGLGKSFVTLDLTARVSTGQPLPDVDDSLRESNSGVSEKLRYGAAADVLLVNCEDDPADTVGPRLTAAGADLARISILEAVRRTGGDGESREESFSLVDHIAALEEALDCLREPRLLVIDPISGFLAGVDTHRNADVRAVLAPLAALAARRSLAVIAVTHLAKNNQGPAVQRAMGSLAFAAAARAVWMIVRDPQDAARRLMLPAKNNLAADDSGLAYRLVASGSEAIVEWEAEPVTIALDQLGPPQPRRAAPLRDRAAQWLARFLAPGAQRAADVYSQGRDQGFGRDALREALGDLGGLSVRTADGNHWQLEPDERPERPTLGETRPLRQQPLPAVAVDVEVQRAIEAALYD